MLAGFNSWCMKFNGKKERSVYLLVLMEFEAYGIEFSIPPNSQRLPGVVWYYVTGFLAKEFDSISN
jgi:hypothetical protein